MVKSIGMHESDALRYTVRGLFVLTTAVACVFGLARWLDDYGGMVVAIPIAVVPLCLVIERVFSESKISCAPRTIGSYVWHHALIVCAACTTAIAAWIGSSAGVPTLTSPLPFLVVLPLLFSVPRIVAMTIPVAIFLILNLYLGRAEMPHAIPFRFTALLSVATAFSIYWFANAVKYSYGYHGPTYTIGITIINVSIIVALWIVWFFIRRRASYSVTLAWSLAMTCWLFWFAFPWLGEMI